MQLFIVISAIKVKKKFEIPEERLVRVNNAFIGTIVLIGEQN